MRITSIELINFQCFYGDDNRLDFSAGLNVVIGKNGAGKSKIFNGFNWCLNNRYYEKGWVTVVNSQQLVDLVSKSAIREAGVDTAVPVKVSVAFELDKEQVGICDLALTRSFNFKNGLAYNESWILGFVKGGEYSEISEKEVIQSMLDGWFDPSVRDYMLFQGETLEEMVDFRARGSLARLTDNISSFRLFEDLSHAARLFAQYSALRHRKELRDHTTNSRESDRIKADLQKLEQDLATREEFVKVLKEDVLSCDEAIKIADETIRKTAESAEAVREVDKKEVFFKGRGDVLEARREAFNSSRSAGEFLGCEVVAKESFFPSVEAFRDKVGNRIAELDGNVRGVISLEVPRASDLERLIEAERCDVCGTEAKKGSEAYRNMVERLKKMLSVSSMNTELRELDRLLREIPEIVESFDGLVKRANERKDSLEGSIQAAEDEWVIARDDFRNAKASLTGSPDAQKDFDAAKVNKERAERTRRQKLASLEDHQLRLESLKLKRNNLNSDLKGLVSEGSVDLRYPKRERLGEFVQEMMETLKESEKEGLLISIESRANVILRDLTQGSSSFVATLEVDKENMTFRAVDSDGESPALNSGLLDMCNIAVLTAILQLTKEKTGSSYPLVCDAPTSKLDLDIARNYLRVNASAFDQSILLSKDYKEEDVARLRLSNFSVFKLQPSKLDGSKIEGENQSVSDLKVNILKLS